jgi:hypothetical protein
VTIAEYVAAFISIMIGLALADLAASFQRLLRAGKRVKWDLLTPATAVLVTAFVINVWWVSFATVNALSSISVASFIPDLISLILLYCLACSALPDEVPETIDLAGYYRENKNRLWGLFTLYTLWVTLVAGVRAQMANASTTAMAGAVVPNLIIVLLMTILIWTPRRWVHVAVTGLLLLISASAWLPQELRIKGGP